MVRVKKITLEDSLYYQKHLLLYYKIEYPQFYSNTYKSNLNRMNNYYKNRALEMQRYCVTIMFNTAISQFEFAVSRGYTYRIFQLDYIYNITLNENCCISLYYDHFTYMGGAHGTTLRTSDTWDIQTGNKILLCTLFNQNINYLDYIKTSVIKQIEEQLMNEEYVYFDDYINNVANNLDCNSYYLNPYGVVIYFQLYEIAPYAAGIPEFLILYEDGILSQPKCD